MVLVLYVNLIKSSPARTIRSISCSQDWCSEYCDSNLDATEKGKKFMARCLQTQECQCLYPWRQGTDSMMTWSRMN
uniref:Uncharacterized protein n=1 Tax=Panagrolaimus sp. ES5 TaxID=591445 RepID=A0AC34F8P2_9BILA